MCRWHIFILVLWLNHHPTIRWKWTEQWVVRSAEKSVRCVRYYATLRRELQHAACSTKQQRLAAKNCSEDSTRLALLYLHEVHQFKSEIINTQQNPPQADQNSQIQSCRKRRDRERAEEEARDGWGEREEQKGWCSLWLFVCLRMKNILEIL